MTNIYQIQAQGLVGYHSECEEIFQQMSPHTATWGLIFWERELNIKAIPSDSIELRRARVLAKFVQMPPITQLTIKQVVDVFLRKPSSKVVKWLNAYAFVVTMPYDDVQWSWLYQTFETIEEMKPAHLEPIYETLLGGYQNLIRQVDKSYRLAPIMKFYHEVQSRVLRKTTEVITKKVTGEAIFRQTTKPTVTSDENIQIRSSSYSGYAHYLDAGIHSFAGLFPYPVNTGSSLSSSIAVQANDVDGTSEFRNAGATMGSQKNNTVRSLFSLYTGSSQQLICGDYYAGQGGGVKLV